MKWSPSIKNNFLSFQDNFDPQRHNTRPRQIYQLCSYKKSATARRFAKFAKNYDHMQLATTGTQGTAAHRANSANDNFANRKKIACHRPEQPFTCISDLSKSFCHVHRQKNSDDSVCLCVCVFILPSCGVGCVCVCVCARLNQRPVSDFLPPSSLVQCRRQQPV